MSPVPNREVLSRKREIEDKKTNCSVSIKSWSDFFDIDATCKTKTFGALDKSPTSGWGFRPPLPPLLPVHLIDTTASPRTAQSSGVSVRILFSVWKRTIKFHHDFTDKF